MSTTATTVDLEASVPAQRAAGRPYARSWPNVLASWLERVPGPTWLAYAGATALAILLSAAQAAIDGVEPIGGTFALLYYAVLPFGALGLMHVLDRTAAGALRALRPVLDIDDSEASALQYELTVAPARPAAILTLLAFATTPIGYIMDPAGSGIVGYSPMALAFRFAWESLISAVFLVLVYHTLRQLRLIDRIHARIDRIDVFDQGPLYAFSQVTSRTALGLILLLAPSIFLIAPDADGPFLAITVAWYGLAVVIAALAFLLPLRGMHDRLSGEKRRWQGEIGRRLTSTLDAIHAAVDAGDGDAIESRNRALSALIAERDLVNRIPTWPWSTGALTGFLSAVMLPLVLFLAQRVLGDVLGG